MAKLELTELHNREHDQASGIDTKKVSIFGYDPIAGTPRRIAVDENGMLVSPGFVANADITTEIVKTGTTTVITDTDGVKTLTTTIDTSTPDDVSISEIWS